MEAPIQQDLTEVQTETPSVPQTTEIPEGSQPQSVAPATVDSGQSTSQAQPQGSPDYETARQIKNLMKEIRSLKQSFETRSLGQPTSAPQTQAPKFTREELLQNPLETINRMIEAQTSQIKNELPQVVQQREAEWKMEQARQEGLKLIKTNELIKRDPQGRERMEEILNEEDEDGNSLDKYSIQNPKHAAQLALKEYQTRYGQGARMANPPTKAQMISTATAQNSGGGRSTTSAEIGSIYAQLAAMPDLMKDPAFMARLDAVVKKSDMESLLGK